MKIAIIGCGYVGKAVARLWNEGGHDLTVTTTTPDKIAELEQIANRVIVLTGDNFETLRDTIQDRDLVLLCVAPNRRGFSGYQETYLNTAKNLREALKNSEVQQLIYTGSYSVLGDKEGEWTDEETPPTPADQKGEVLQATEQVLLSVQNETRKACILRLGGIYGSGREIVDIFRPVAGTTRPGDGEDDTNWIHLDDIVRAIDFAREKQLEGIYNLVNDQPVKTREITDYLSEEYDLKPVSWDSSSTAVRPYNTRLSNQKIKSEGFEFNHPETLPSK